ncbi:MAG: hypothetical protein Q8K29_02430 [Polaromonas sp.]|nr:hypothetical protein [Polaromonas sp.]
MTTPDFPFRAVRGAAPFGLRGPAATLWLVAALALAGCASVAPPRASSPPPAVPAPGAPVPAPGPAAVPPGAPAAPTAPGAVPNARTAGAEVLAIEQRWLQDWFRGTPVRIAQRSDGTLTVDVPREFSFDAGRSQVKPALAAVLDKVAETLRRRPTTHLTLLAAPTDPASGSPPTLALQRAAGVQRHLRDRGVAPARLGAPLADGSAAVQLRIGTLAP